LKNEIYFAHQLCVELEVL